MGASRLVIVGGRRPWPESATATSSHAHAEKMSIGSDATHPSAFPGERVAISTRRKASGFIAVPHEAVAAAFFRHGAMLAFAKR
jgi:hypothetical protein